MNNLKDKKAIIHKLATRYEMPLSKIEEIINHQFKFVAKIMKKGDFEMIRLPYFGKFSAKKERIKYINKMKKDV